jgi:hypothetical protein
MIPRGSLRDGDRSRAGTLDRMALVPQAKPAVGRMSEDQALRVMMTAHRRGVCVVAVDTKDVAEAKWQRARRMRAGARAIPCCSRPSRRNRSSGGASGVRRRLGLERAWRMEAGGSFVIAPGNVPLIIAGGGGSGGLNPTDGGNGGPITSSGGGGVAGGAPSGDSGGGGLLEDGSPGASDIDDRRGSGSGTEG